MAKGSGSKGDGRSKIRVVVFEADLAEGELREVTQALTNALRPAPIVQRFITSSGQTSNNAAQFDEIEDAEVVEEQQAEEVRPAARRTASKGPRQFYKPKILTNVDLTSGEKPFADFVREKGSPTETSKRFLAVAAWFHLYRGTDAITPDHVYTCYRAMEWTLDMKDVGQPFRDLKAQGWGDYKNREFEINHIGLGQVQKLGTSDATA